MKYVLRIAPRYKAEFTNIHDLHDELWSLATHNTRLFRSFDMLSQALNHVLSRRFEKANRILSDVGIQIQVVPEPTRPDAREMQGILGSDWLDGESPADLVRKHREGRA